MIKLKKTSLSPNCQLPNIFGIIYIIYSSTTYHTALGKKTLFGILLPKLFWPTVRKKISSDREKLLKFKDEGQEFSKFLRSLGQFIQTKAF